MKKGVVIGIIVAIAIGIGASLAMSYNNESLNGEVILNEEVSFNEEATIDTDEPSEVGGKSYKVDLIESLTVKTP